MKQLRELSKPFAAKLIEKKPGGTGGDYVSHSTVTERALSILGGYSIEDVELIKEADGMVTGALVQIACEIDGNRVRMIEAGDVENPTRHKTNGARAKDAMSDAVKRCWMRLGLGLHLWSQENYFLHAYLTREYPDEVPAVQPEKPQEPEQESPVGIGEAHANRLSKKLQGLGVSHDLIGGFINHEFGLSSLESYATLTAEQAGRVWAFAITQAAKEETAKPKAPEYTAWKDDEAARAYGAASGLFADGEALMAEWAKVVKAAGSEDPSTLYPIWFNHLQGLLKAQRKAA